MAMTDDEYTGNAYDARLMRRILKYARPYKKLVFGGVLLTLFASFLQLVGPYLTKTAIDDYIAVKDLSGLYQKLRKMGVFSYCGGILWGYGTTL